MKWMVKVSKQNKQQNKKKRMIQNKELKVRCLKVKTKIMIKLKTRNSMQKLENIAVKNETWEILFNTTIFKYLEQILLKKGKK